jgi:7-alpha-hydroxysteroid dehydrogenase
LLLDLFRVDGQVAIVTGAGRGIGEGIAVGLAECGADVVLASRSEPELRAVAARVEALGRRAVVAVTDVRDNEATAGLVDIAVAELGGVDIVVNNAGAASPMAFLDTPPELLDEAFHLNVTPAFVLTKAAVPSMLDRGGGSVVNISSAISRFANRGILTYATAKAALSHLTRLMAHELSPRIRVNAIAPGSIATPSLAGVLENDEMREDMARNTPMRRIGAVADIAAACLWLASDAGGFVTGKIVEVDGGLQASNLTRNLPDL